MGRLRGSECSDWVIMPQADLALPWGAHSRRRGSWEGSGTRRGAGL